VVVGVDNPDQKLLPGMTTNVRVVVESRADILKVPNAALRFRPAGEEPAPRPSVATPPGQPGGDRRPGGGLASLEDTRERLGRELRLTEEQQKNLEPILQEARAAFMGLARVEPQQRRAAGSRIREEARQKIRALLTPDQQALYDQLPAGQPARAGTAGLTGRVWILGPEGKPRAVPLRLGISDGTYTEVLEGDLKDGQDLIIGTVGLGGSGAGASSPSAGGPRARF
jgi:HlyD family secretion protein